MNAFSWPANLCVNCSMGTQILKDMAAGTSTWVGRMQQVAILKDKVKELQKAQGTVQDSKVERDNLERIRKLRADKMQKEENTAVELEKARAEVQQLKVVSCKENFALHPFLLTKDKPVRKNCNLQSYYQTRETHLYRNSTRSPRASRS